MPAAPELTVVSQAEARSMEFIDAAVSLGITRLHDFFRSEAAVEESLRVAVTTGALRVPSVFSERSAVCCGSYVGAFNYLLFDDAGRRFVVVQHQNAVAAIVLLQQGVVIGIPRAFDRLIPKTLAADISGLFSLRSPSGVLEPSTFLGLLDGYARPYHYFYDRLPYLVRLRSRVPRLKVVSVSSCSFWPHPEPAAGFADAGALNRYAASGNYAFWSPSRYGDPLAPWDSARLILDYAGLLAGRGPRDCCNRDVVVWIGLCSEKRAWPERIPAIVTLVSAIVEWQADATFVFDGLTAPEGESRERFRDSEPVRTELRALRSILEALPREVRHLDLIGSHARDKVVAALRTDYFFANALTDSMWPAHFGRACGLAYGATVTDLRGHDHPRTFCLPHQYVRDHDDGQTNYAKKGYSIDPDVIAELAVLGVRSALDQRRLLDERLYPEPAGKVTVREDQAQLPQQHWLELGVPKGSEEWCAIGDGTPGFGDSSRALPVLARSYSFRFDGSTTGSACIQLCVASYDDAGALLGTFCVPPQEACSVDFSERAAKYRLFLRLSGRGHARYGGGFGQPLGSR